MDKSILDKLSIKDPKTKIQDLLIDEIIYLKNTMPFEKYCIFVENYLYARIRNNVACTDEEIRKLRQLYSTFSSEEKTTLKYLQKLYNYIDDLIYISKDSSYKKDIKIKTNKLSIKKLIYLKNETYTAKFISYVKKYLIHRINKKIYCDDRQINGLKELVELIIEDEKIRDDQKKEVKKLVTKLIVYSKYSEKKNYQKRISNLNTLPKEELYTYLETIIEYAYFSIEEKDLYYIIDLFKNNLDYLEKVENLLKSHNIEGNYYDSINNYKSRIKRVLEFRNEFPQININYDGLNQELPFIEDKNIITIDEEFSPDLDGAFSIEKKGDIYVLEVYVTDVPSFLLQNEDLMKEAYKRSTSMYNSQNSKELLIRDMLPKELSHDLLSLKKDQIRNVITFTYHIDSSGNISLEDISRNSVYINDNIKPETASNIILSQSKDSRTHQDLRTYKDVCELITNSSEEKYLKEANLEKIYNIIGIPSILTNYHIGNNSDFAIYREKGIYTKESKNKYTHSVTPLRKFVSNINLVFYLNQLGIINCPDKYLYYVEDHLDEIIEHINNQEKTKETFQKNRRLIKKYYE